MTDPPWDRLWTEVSLATMTGPPPPTKSPVALGVPGSGHPPATTDQHNLLGIITDGAIGSSDGRIAWIGNEADLPAPPERCATQVIPCRGAWMTPGLIDCHTHIVFGGDRLHDFRRRLHGESYEAIARAGGGIASTVNATRRASTEELTLAALRRARELAEWGVTTIEVKSGYGLDLATELKMLEIAAALPNHLPVDTCPTLLAAHAIPPEYAHHRADYIRYITDEIIPAAVEQGHATAVDVFCDSVAFSADEARPVLEAGLTHGLHGRVHADQLSDSGGGELAAAVGAKSADHLEYLSSAGVRAMAESGVSAVLLPGAAYTLGARQRPPVVQLRQAGVPIVLATDANPGSSPITNVGMVLNLACVLFGLTPEEALLGFTRAAAQVLGLEADRGTLEPGKRADFALWDVDNLAEICYWMSSSPLIGRVKDGEPVA